MQEFFAGCLRTIQMISIADVIDIIAGLDIYDQLRVR